MSEPIIKIVLCMCPNLDVARHIGTHAIENQIAACVNLIPKVESIYQWDDKINNDSEVLCLFKTKKELLDELKLHPYEVPEIIYLDVEGGSKNYLKWISQSTKTSE
ncbi:MAG: divalent-cation tolerance protein CutA [Verrucomicrobiales bacterium]